MKVHKKQKVTALVVKFESNVNGVMEVTDHWNVDTVVIQGTPWIQRNLLKANL